MLGAASGPRHDAFARACIDRFGTAPDVIGWDRFLAEPARLAEMLPRRGTLRIDTPDQDVGAIGALLKAGAAAADAAGIETVPEESEELLAQGDIGSPGQVAFGLIAGVELAEAIAHAAEPAISTSAADVACAFDKAQTTKRFAEAGLPVPRVLTGIDGFDALADAMARARMSRVFVKLRHGSAAAGMVALARNGDQWAAMTTAVAVGGRVQATRAVRRLTDPRAIGQLIDRLAPLGLHVEAWVPKIAIAGRTADVRIVWVRGAGPFPVLRTSRYPMTNLHLGGARHPIARLVERIGEEAWAEVEASARRAAALFPASDAIGVDVAVLNDGRQHRLLEANVFGDFVKDLNVAGRTPYDAQLDLVARHWAAAASDAA
ncbi:STM4014 family protein [Allosphingosinicella deserti]|uniref:ATP-grasp domain-containing protein n=1 Tax=Allosphingosinicella deserti TaxID=2116704 RepID=A0A2P7QY37_9SPHN|nr:STM4014 family protein [Sphingomonas deserti]PSJ42877.1 hypothetical protein C7I55_00170 [Sphingomonas deserti]